MVALGLWSASPFWLLHFYLALAPFLELISDRNLAVLQGLILRMQSPTFYTAHAQYMLLPDDVSTHNAHS